MASGFAIRLIISAPLIGVRFVLWILGFVVDLQTQNYDVAVTSGLSFIENSVLQLPLFLMTAMRHLTPAMDEMWVTLVNAGGSSQMQVLMRSAQVHDIPRMGRPHLP